MFDTKVISWRLLSATLLLGGVAACDRSDSQAAAAQAGEKRVVACDLITAAEAAAVLGQSTADRDAYQSDNASVCTLVGAHHAVTLRVFHPFHGAGSNTAEWVARLRAERAEAAEEETDADLKKALAEVRIEPYDRLGVTAAREDIFEQVALHALKGGAGGVYLSVYTAELDVAHSIAEAALAKIR